MGDRTLSYTYPSHTFSVDALSVRVYPSAIELARDAALMTHNYLQSLLKQQSVVRIVLATGNSQVQFLETLSALQGLDWSRIILFHLDEYLGIAANHPGSFRRYLREKVEKKVKPYQFHYIQGDAPQPLAECHRYSQLLQQQPIDLCCLGVGKNGHLAFNEPSVVNFSDPYRVKLVGLEEKTRQQQVNSGYFPHLEAVPQYAYTLTIPTICAAKKIFCLAPGKHKAEIIKKMLRGAISPACPASILRKQSQAILFLDANSAHQLSVTSQ
ncbi:glucosamine-6-phosphate deaminase [Pleurocapsales cyanobacterium LEGE 06147]|nr:glucosamine-6-phosphate deaminase [Pleurocapsales cyanobacterium LEGE 06147]